MCVFLELLHRTHTNTHPHTYSHTHMYYIKIEIRAAIKMNLWSQLQYMGDFCVLASAFSLSEVGVIAFLYLVFVCLHVFISARK